MFFLIFVLLTFLRVLYNNIHHHVNQRSKLHTYSAEVPVLRTPLEVRFSMTCRLYRGKGNEGLYIYRRSCRSLSLMLSCLTVSFSCVVYKLGNRMTGSEKKQTLVYLIKRKMKKFFFVHVPGTYISHFVVALAAGVKTLPGRYFSSMHLVSTTQSTTITEASRSKGQK